MKGSTKNTLPATLSKVTYVGKHLECMAMTEAGPIFALCNDVDAAFKPGDKVGLDFPGRGPVLVAE